MNAKRESISSDLKRLDKMSDADIDYSDIPPLDESFLEKELVGNLKDLQNPPTPSSYAKA